MFLAPQIACGAVGLAPILSANRLFLPALHSTASTGIQHSTASTGTQHSTASTGAHHRSRLLAVPGGHCHSRAWLGSPTEPNTSDASDPQYIGAALPTRSRDTLGGSVRRSLISLGRVCCDGAQNPSPLIRWIARCCPASGAGIWIMSEKVKAGHCQKKLQIQQ